jgi:transaldolase
MKIFLDTAHVPAINDTLPTGLIDGITTNPTLLSKEGSSPVELLTKLCALVHPRPVSIEVTENDPQHVYRQAQALSRVASNVVVKIPCAYEYVPIIHKLVQEKVPLNITLLFSLNQGLLMAKLGVAYISPFIGRLDDTEIDGIDLIYDLRTMLDRYHFETQLLAASIRSALHLHKVALVGADIATVPVALFQSLLNHPLTDKGRAQFDRDWHKLGITQFP